MPESAGGSDQQQPGLAPTTSAAIPDDIRHLKNFPHYDTTLHDNPKFRQNLTSWASKTEKLSNVLDTLATGFSAFYESGLQQYKAASTIAGSLEKMSQLLEGSSPTITEPLNKFVESLNNMWHYYETYLEQTQTLTVDPIRKMAKQFSILKGIYEELQTYRKQFLMAADQMCASRHVSKSNDSQQFHQLAETCYNAQKTYQLVLSKYLTCLREAHTIDMMDLLRRLMEHFLSIYSYHNYCAEQMKDLEVYLSGLYTQTKEWKCFYSGEMELWNELQRHIKKIVMLNHQNRMDHLPCGDPFAGRHGVLKPMKKKMLHHQSSLGGGTVASTTAIPFARTTSDQLLNQFLSTSAVPTVGESGALPTITSPVQQRKMASESPMNSPKATPLRAFSIPVFPEPGVSEKKPGFSKLRSSSDADVLGPSIVESSHDENGDTFGSLKRRSQSIDDLILSGDEEKEASLDTASQKIEAILGDTMKMPKSGNKPFSLLTNLRRKEHKSKIGRQKKRTPSVDDEQMRSRSGSTTPVDCRSADNSPFAGRKKRSLQKQLKKARNSLYLFQQKREQTTEDDDDPLSGRGSTEGRVSAEASSISSSEQEIATPTTTNNGILCYPPSPAASGVVSVSPPHSREAEVRELITPVSPSWTKSGYLMLRMKLPNNTYAWTYIYCVVNRDSGQLMVQEQSLPEPRPLEDLMLCTCKAGTPDFIDRNFCFRVISPSSEHLFQALGDEDMRMWMSAIQEGIECAIKHGDTGTRPKQGKREDEGELVPNAIKTILKVPGNKQCADCSSNDVQWASINLGIVLCIECSGAHRGLGVHVSKVRSLTLDKWNKPTVEFMKSQGNTKSNVYYESRLGKGAHSDIHKPSANAGKAERMQFIQLKYVTLAFTPELTRM